MRVLITGGAGFIGCNLAAACIGAGHRVTVFDNLSRRGSPANLDWLRASFGARARSTSYKATSGMMRRSCGLPRARRRSTIWRASPQ